MNKVTLTTTSVQVKNYLPTLKGELPLVRSVESLAEIECSFVIFHYVTRSGLSSNSGHNPLRG